jgi:mRNA-degrading endonuclease RelE of RelBE toxin-antitoxin system
MRVRVEVGSQVQDFVRSLAPTPRRALTQAIKSLAQDAGDRKLLEGKLAGYHRLRVAGYRVIYREQPVGGARVIFCIFAERRSIVYELFQQMLLKELSQ